MSQKTKKPQKIKQYQEMIKNGNLTKANVDYIDNQIADLKQCIREIKFNINNNISIYGRRIA